MVVIVLCQDNPCTRTASTLEHKAGIGANATVVAFRNICEPTLSRKPGALSNTDSDHQSCGSGQRQSAHIREACTLQPLRILGLAVAASCLRPNQHV